MIAVAFHSSYKLEEPEHLRSKNTPRRHMITDSIDSYRIQIQN